VDLTVDLVGNADKEPSSSEGVDIVIGPLLREDVVLDTLKMPGSIQSLSELEHVGRAVKVAPKDLTVIGVGTASEGLLTSVVEEGDTSGSKSEGKGALEESLVRLRVQEAGVVMIVHKDAESVNILEVLVVSLPSASNISHALSVHPDVTDSEVHRVVEEGGNIVLVRANVCIVSIEVFAHLEDASGLAELRPEILGDLWDGVDTDTVETILFHEILDPALEVSADIRVILVKIRKTGKTAVLDLPLVVPIIDVTITMVM
jgi:hypothetical protein